MQPHGIVHRILQVRILECVAFPFSRGSSQPRDQTRSPALQADSLRAKPQGKPKNTGVGCLSLLQWIFPTQESNQCLLHCRQILYRLGKESALFSLLIPMLISTRISIRDIPRNNISLDMWSPHCSVELTHKTSHHRVLCSVSVFSFPPSTFNISP